MGTGDAAVSYEGRAGVVIARRADGGSSREQYGHQQSPLLSISPAAVYTSRPARPSFESLGAFPGSLADYRLVLSPFASVVPKRLSLFLLPSVPAPRLHFAVSLRSSVCPFPSSGAGGARRQRSSHVRVRRGLSRLTLLQGWSLK